MNTPATVNARSTEPAERDPSLVWHEAFLAFIKEKKQSIEDERKAEQDRIATAKAYCNFT